MNIEEKNKIIKNYLEKKIKETEKDYPGIFNNETLDKAEKLFIDSLESVEDIKKKIDELQKKQIESYNKMKRKNEIYYYSDVIENNRESRTFNQIKNAFNKIDELVKNTDLKLYICGGIVPYLLLNQDSNRLHDDIDYICQLSDMPKFRKLFKDAYVYDENWDSLNFVKDGNDYGFEFMLDDVPIGINPFTYDGNILTQYTYDPYNTRCKIKKGTLNDLSQYVNTYKSLDGKRYNMQCIELIKKSKDLAGRPKDIIDSKKFLEYGINQDLYDKITKPLEIQNKKAAELDTKISD